MPEHLRNLLVQKRTESDYLLLKGIQSKISAAFFIGGLLRSVQQKYRSRNMQVRFGLKVDWES